MPPFTGGFSIVTTRPRVRPPFLFYLLLSKLLIANDNTVSDRFRTRSKSLTPSDPINLPERSSLSSLNPIVVVS